MGNKVTCTCGHSWNKSDSSKKDATVCHICGKDNEMENGGWLDKYNEGGELSKAQMGKNVFGVQQRPELNIPGTNTPVVYKPKAEIPNAPVVRAAGDNTTIAKPITQNSIGFSFDPDVIEYNKIKNDPSWGEPYKFLMNWYSDPETKRRLISQGAPETPMTEALNQNRYNNYLDWYLAERNKNTKTARSIYEDDVTETMRFADELNQGLESQYKDLKINTSGFHKPKDSLVALNKNISDDNEDMYKTAVHELTHATPLDDFYVDYFKKNKPKNPKGTEANYFSDNPEEIYPRIQDLRYQLWKDKKIAPRIKVTPDMLKGYANDSSEDIRNYYSPEELAKIMNEVASTSSNKRPITQTRDGGWLDKYEQGGMVLKQKTNDNYGKKDNPNDVEVSVGDDYVGLAYDTTGRNYSPAWGGAWKNGGMLQPPMAQNGKSTSVQDWLKMNSARKQFEPSASLDSRVNLIGLPEKTIVAVPSASLNARPTERLSINANVNAPFIISKKGIDSGEVLNYNIGAGYQLNRNNYIGASYNNNQRFGLDFRHTLFNNNKKKEFQLGGTIPGSVGFTYARTGDTPSEGPYAKKTLPSAQNGQEMRYYQEGLDWKPKNISRNGGWLDAYDVPKAQVGIQTGKPNDFPYHPITNRFGVKPKVTIPRAPEEKTYTKVNTSGLQTPRASSVSVAPQNNPEFDIALEKALVNAKNEQKYFLGQGVDRPANKLAEDIRLKQLYVQKHPNAYLTEDGQIKQKNLDRDLQNKPLTALGRKQDASLERVMNVLDGVSLATGVAGIASNLSRLGAFALQKKIGKNWLSQSIKNTTASATPYINAIDEAAAYVTLDPISMMGNKLNADFYNPYIAMNTVNNSLTGVEKNLKNSAIETAGVTLGENNLKNINYNNYSDLVESKFKNSALQTNSLTPEQNFDKTILKLDEEMAAKGYTNNYSSPLNDAQYEKWGKEIFRKDADLISIDELKQAHKESLDYFKGAIGTGGKEYGLFIKNKFAERIPNFNSIKFDENGNRAFENQSVVNYNPELLGKITNLKFIKEQGYDITKMTPQERMLMEGYAHGYDNSLNGALRDPAGSKISQFYLGNANVLNQGILKNKFADATTVRRGIGGDYDVELLDPVTYQPTGVKKLRSQLVKGDAFKDPSFISTSTNPESTWGDASLSETIEIPGGGIQSLGVPEAATSTYYRGENEAILPTGLVRQIIDDTGGLLGTPKYRTKILNPYKTVPFIAGAAALSNIYKGTPSQPEQQKKGGIIKDNRGQWAHPGEITQINSPYITMEGVPYPVLGIADTGEEQMMYPGQDYEFEGAEYVTEYPKGKRPKKAKNGVNQADENSLVQLDQLTNFTNYNKPTKGGWLDKY